MSAQFLELAAAADFLGNGAIEVNKYESEILDVLRRTSPTLDRWQSLGVNIPATGHPHRYFEQTAIAVASFTDPRTIAPSATSPTRVERSAMIKALTAQSNFSLFDVDVTRMQGQFATLEAKDIQDITSSVIVAEANAVWAGTDTSLTTPTTTQYMGLLRQITQQATVASGASIIDGLKAQVALMVASASFVVRPTAIYLNPILSDLIDREAKAAAITLSTVQLAVGVTVNALNTQAGVLPLIPDPFIPTEATAGTTYGFAAPGGGNKGYYAVIVSESGLEMPTVHGGDGNMAPRLFQLGLLSGLQAQYVAVHFNAVIAKGPSYLHSVVQVVRP